MGKNGAYSIFGGFGKKYLRNGSQADHSNPLNQTNSDAPSEEQITEWTELGEVAKLEQLVLDGRGHMLRDKNTHNIASKEFLKTVVQYQVSLWL